MGQPCEDLEATLNALGSALEPEHHAHRLSVSLSAALCRPFLLPSLASLQPEEAAAALQATARRRTGFQGPCKVWQDLDRSGNPTMAAAIEQSLLDQLTALRTTGGRKLQVVSIRPAWADWLKVALTAEPGAACTALHDWDAVTLLGGQGTGFSLAVSALTTPDGVPSHEVVARLLLSADRDYALTSQARIHLRGQATTSATTSPLAPLLEVLT